MKDNKENCPLCAADLQGYPIPKAQQGLFGGATHFSRKIGLYDYDTDRTRRYMCPDCKGEWLP